MDSSSPSPNRRGQDHIKLVLWIQQSWAHHTRTCDSDKIVKLQNQQLVNTEQMHTTWKVKVNQNTPESRLVHVQQVYEHQQLVHSLHNLYAQQLVHLETATAGNCNSRKLKQQDNGNVYHTGVVTLATTNNHQTS